MLLHDAAGWRRQGSERFYSTLRRGQRSDDSVCSLGTPDVVYTVWAFLLRICRGAMWGGLLLRAARTPPDLYGRDECCYSVLPCLRCRTHAVCADGHSSGAEYGSMCVAHGTAQHMFFVGLPKGEAHRRCVIPATVHYPATVRAAVRCATVSLCLCEKWGA
ncbi:hypothetical protein TcG_05597 [Trypanosoma cruzi]|nr:hypothetical protein TcG_05597 [Trypanosoma cruzi]